MVRKSQNFASFLSNRHFDEKMYDVMKKAISTYIDIDGNNRKKSAIKEDILDNGLNFMEDLINEVFKEVWNSV
jgi:hypothetical protein